MQPEDLERVDAAPNLEAPYEPVFSLPLEEKREPFWDYVDLLVFIGLGVVAFLLVNVAGLAWIHFDPKLRKDMTPLLMPLQYLAYALVYLCFYCIFKFRYDQPVLRSLGFVRTNYGLLSVGAGGVVLAMGLAVVANLIHTPKVDTPFDQLGNTPFALFILAFTAIVAAPFMEEMVFRGFLQPLFSRTVGAALGILFTALLFGGLHATEYQFAWQYVAAISVVGVVLGMVRLKTKSTLPGAVMHGCFNAVSVVGLIAAKYFPPHK